MVYEAKMEAITSSTPQNFNYKLAHKDKTNPEDDSPPNEMICDTFNETSITKEPLEFFDK